MSSLEQVHQVEASALSLRVATSSRGRCRLQLSGRVDGTTVGLVIAVLEYENRCGRRGVRIDLSDVDYVDNEAMDSLLAARRALLMTGATMEIVGLRVGALAGRLATHGATALRLVSDEN